MKLRNVKVYPIILTEQNYKKIMPGEVFEYATEGQKAFLLKNYPACFEEVSTEEVSDVVAVKRAKNTRNKLATNACDKEFL